MNTSAATTTQPGATGSTVAVGEIVTHYHDVGAGAPLLLLHGSGPGVSAMANWRHTMGPLAEHFRVLAPDMVGFGYTSRPDGIVYGPDTWLAHVVGFLDALGIERAHVIGNSLGARIALGLALQHPDRVDRLVLYGSYADGHALGPPKARSGMVDLVRSHWGWGSRLLADMFGPSWSPEDRAAFTAAQRACADRTNAAEASSPTTRSAPVTSAIIAVVFPGPQPRSQASRGGPATAAARNAREGAANTDARTSSRRSAVAVSPNVYEAVILKSPTGCALTWCALT